MSIDIGRALTAPFNPAAPAGGGGLVWNPQTQSWEQRPATRPQIPPAIEALNLPPTMGTQAPLPGPPKEGMLQALWRNIKDPRVQMFLSAMGSTLAQPRQFGQTGIGQASNAINAGYGALYQANELQRQAQLEARKQALAEVEAGARVEASQAQAAQARASAGKTEVETGLLGPKFDWDRQVKALELANDAKTLESTITNNRRSWMEADRTYNRLLQQDFTKENRDVALDALARAKTNAEIAHLNAQTAELKKRTLEGDPGDQRAFMQLYSTAQQNLWNMINLDPLWNRKSYGEKKRYVEAEAQRLITAAGYKGAEVNPMAVGPVAPITRTTMAMVEEGAKKAGVTPARFKADLEAIGIEIVDSAAPITAAPSPVQPKTGTVAAPSIAQPKQSPPTTSFLEEQGKNLQVGAAVSKLELENAARLAKEGAQAIYEFVGGGPDEPKLKRTWSLFSKDVQNKVRKWLQDKEQGYKDTLKPSM